MGDHCAPITAYMSSPKGLIVCATIPAMKKRPTAQILAANVNRLMDAGKWANRRLSKASGVSEGAIQRARRADVSANLETIEGLAAVFHVDPWMMLVEDLDPANLPTMTFPTAQERKLYERFKSLADEIGKI